MYLIWCDRGFLAGNILATGNLRSLTDSLTHWLARSLARSQNIKTRMLAMSGDNVLRNLQQVSAIMTAMCRLCAKNRKLIHNQTPQKLPRRGATVGLVLGCRTRDAGKMFLWRSICKLVSLSLDSAISNEMKSRKEYLNDRSDIVTHTACSNWYKVSLFWTISKSK